MTIELRSFASGDTDYISKLNANVSEITAAINALQAAAGSAGAGSAVSVGAFMEALFNSADCLVGPSSYTVFQHSTTLTVDPGAMYMADQQAVVSSLIPTTLNFLGQTARTYYIVIDSGGVPTFRTTLLPGTIYSVVWTGSAFTGQPERIAACFYDASEATASRTSTFLTDPLSSPTEPQDFSTLDDRLEAMEEMTADARDVVTSVSIRKVGLTVDGSGSVIEPGVKSALQLDYGGTIIGWSIIADRVGDITIAISKAASGVPPAAPTIPDPTTDKISALAPISLSGAQSAAGGVSAVSTWDPDVSQWDVIQFEVTAVSLIKRATFYVRIAGNTIISPPDVPFPGL